MSIHELFLAEHPEFAEALKQYDEVLDAFASNTFVTDVVSKFRRYGSLTPAQVEAVTASIQRCTGAAPVDPKVEAPVGRQTVTGEVLSLKEKDSVHGRKLKMLVRLPNEAKVWVSAPKDRTVAKGDTITFTSTFERSKNDPSFAFGSRTEYGAIKSEAPKATKSHKPYHARTAKSATLSDAVLSHPLHDVPDPDEAPFGARPATRRPRQCNRLVRQFLEGRHNDDQDYSER